MKKILLAASAALCFASGSFAQVEQQGGNVLTGLTPGGLSKPVIVGGGVGLGLALAVAMNQSGTVKKTPVIVDPIDPVDPVDPTCNGSDPLVDGVCVGTTITVTVTGSGTMTSTTTVPDTFTYLPSV